MDCTEFLERYSDYDDSLLGPAENARFCEHLATCPSCARYDRVLRKGRMLARQLPRLEPDRWRLHQSLLPRGRAWRGPVMPARVAAALAAVTVLLVASTGLTLLRDLDASRGRTADAAPGIADARPSDASAEARAAEAAEHRAADAAATPPVDAVAASLADAPAIDAAPPTATAERAGGRSAAPASDPASDPALDSAEAAVPGVPAIRDPELPFPALVQGVPGAPAIPVALGSRSVVLPRVLPPSARPSPPGLADARGWSRGGVAPQVMSSYSPLVTGPPAYRPVRGYPAVPGRSTPRILD